MAEKIPRDSPLYRKLSDLNVPERFLEFVWLITDYMWQEDKILKWLEKSGQTDLQKIADKVFEITDQDRSLKTNPATTCVALGAHAPIPA